MYGLVWTVGSIVGNSIGGFFSHPVERIPWLFKSGGLLEHYPFLLPCLITTAFTLAGLLFAVLFLNEVSRRAWRTMYHTELPHAAGIEQSRCNICQKPQKHITS
jgi:hypothetical protein